MPGGNSKHVWLIFKHKIYLIKPGVVDYQYEPFTRWHHGTLYTERDHLQKYCGRLDGSFIGVTLFSFHNSESVSSSDGFIIGISLAFTACCCSAAVVIMVRKLIQEVHYTLTPFYNSVTTLAVAIILLAFYPSVYNFRYYRLVDIILFMISGIFNYLAQLTKNIASKYGSASFVAPFNYLQVVLLLICDLALFGYTFTLIDYAGVILTFSCVLLPVYQKLSNSIKTTPKN